MLNSLEPFRERRTGLCGLTEIHGWKLKIYGMVADGAELSEETVKAAIRTAEDEVPWPQDIDAKFGFMTIHVGDEAIWALVDIWADDILRHFLFRASHDAPTEFFPAPTDGSMACVWELEVLWHERKAWVRHVLSTPKDPFFEGYMDDVLDVSGRD